MTDPEIIPIQTNVDTAQRAVDYYFVHIRGFSPRTVGHLLNKTDRSVRQNIASAKEDLGGIVPAAPRVNKSTEPQGSELFGLLAAGLSPTPAVDYYLAEIEGMELQAVAMIRDKEISTIEASLEAAYDELGEEYDPDE